ncbi:MAG: hypothetical protein LBM38_02100 [Clostridiales bacterium]|jgi:hypothetical protein|nr:hypothetical protein [Clostridiales bacterium]
MSYENFMQDYDANDLYDVQLAGYDELLDKYNRNERVGLFDLSLDTIKDRYNDIASKSLRERGKEFYDAAIKRIKLVMNGHLSDSNAMIFNTLLGYQLVYDPAVKSIGFAPLTTFNDDMDMLNLVVDNEGNGVIMTDKVLSFRKQDEGLLSFSEKKVYLGAKQLIECAMDESKDIFINLEATREFKKMRETGEIVEVFQPIMEKYVPGAWDFESEDAREVLLSVLRGESKAERMGDVVSIAKISALEKLKQAMDEKNVDKPKNGDIKPGEPGPTTPLKK